MKLVPSWMRIVSAACLLAVFAVFPLELGGYIDRSNRGYVVILTSAALAIYNLVSFGQTQIRAHLWLGVTFAGCAALQAYAMLA